jgi:hypothetical protein
VAAVTNEVNKEMRPAPIKDSPITKEKCLEMLKWRENRKADVKYEMQANPQKINFK